MFYPKHILNYIPFSKLIRLASDRASTIQSASTPGRRLGLRVSENEIVKAGALLCKQRGLRFHPGLNAGIGRDATLFAMLPGRIKVTTEPRPKSIYSVTAKGNRKHVRKYVNVIAEEEPVLFELQSIRTSVDS